MAVQERLSARQAAVITGISLSIEALRALQEAHLSVLRDDYLFAATATEREYFEDMMRCSAARIAALCDAQRIVDSVLMSD